MAKKTTTEAKLNPNNPKPFKSSLNLGAIPKFNEFGDNVDLIILSIPIRNIDEYQFNPRQTDNGHFLEIKESIQKVGLQQIFSVTKNPKTKRYTLVKGGNTRLKAFKALYRETGDVKFSAIDCIVEPWAGEINRTQAVIAHLVENEARGELILVDKAKALIELEGEFKANLNNKKDSDEWSESLSQRQDNYNKTGVFVEYLKDNGYSVSEKQLGLFRFTATKLTGHLDNFLNQGMGSPQIIKIRSVYNNLKNIIKDIDCKNNDNDIIDGEFSVALKKYNKTKKPFEFDKLLDVIVKHLFKEQLFLDEFDNEKTLKEALLNTRKTQKNKDNNIDPDNHVKNMNEGQEGGQSTDITDAELNHDDGIDPSPNNKSVETDKDMGDADTSFADDDTNGEASAKLGADSDNSVPINMTLSYQRRNAYSYAKKIAHKIYIDATIVPIDAGCGFLVVDIVPKSKSNFENWGVWWLLLGYSHAADLLHPIIDIKEITEEGESINIDINQDLLTLYKNIHSKNSAADANLEFINEQSGMYEYRSANLQSVKDMLAPSFWQDVTALEHCCYQIIRAVKSDVSVSLWGK